jgi:hypothetical protein
MSLRCPLCLETLKPDTQLLRFCVSHPAKPAIVYPYRALDKIQCPERKHASMGVMNGTFLLHVGCPSRNMFWNEAEGKVIIKPAEIPGRDKPQVVDHWLLKVLGEIARYAPANQREMWFPEILFRAANLGESNENVGVLVMMVGARSCGKTVFSTMALAQHSYPKPFAAEHFVHVTQGPGAQQSEEHLRILQVLGNMRRMKGTADPPPASMADNIGNIKSVHLSIAAPREKETEATLNARGFLWQTVKNIFGPNGRQTVWKQRVVAFYDMAGEKFEDSLDVKVEGLGAKMDVLAVFVDATAISAIRKPSLESAVDSVWVANDHLQRTKGFPGRRCIIVTKLDQIPLEDVKTYRDTAKDQATDGKQEREMLLGWLEKDKSNPGQAERKLAAEIRDDPSLRVFFIWTTGLGDASAMATAHGITSFILWCLGWNALPGQSTTTANQ